MTSIGSFAKNNAWLILGGVVIGIIFRKPLTNFLKSVERKSLEPEEKATEIVYRPRPIAAGGQFGRTIGQTRVMSTGEVPPMVNRGRAIGQTVANDPTNNITRSPIPMGPVHDPTLDTTMWEGKFTDGALKYTVQAFGSNYSGSVIGAH